MSSLIQLHPSFDSSRAGEVPRSLSVRVHPASELSAYHSQLVDDDVPASPNAGRSSRFKEGTIAWALRQFRFLWAGTTRARRHAGRGRQVAALSGNAVRVPLRSPILPGSVPDRAARVPASVRTGATGPLRRSPSGDPAGNTAPPTAPDCATLYCTLHSIRPHQFVQAVFWKTLYPHARWFGFPVIVFLPWAFARDRGFLAEVGRVRSLRQYADVEKGFHRWSEPRSFLRGSLRLRVSTRRVRRLVEGLIVHPA